MYVYTDLLWLCTKRQFPGDQERELDTLSRMTNRPTVDDDFSSFSDFFFSIVQNRMKKRILEKRSYENTVGVNCRHNTSNYKKGNLQRSNISSDWHATLQAVN